MFVQTLNMFTIDENLWYIVCPHFVDSKKDHEEGNADEMDEFTHFYKSWKGLPANFQNKPRLFSKVIFIHLY